MIFDHFQGRKIMSPWRKIMSPFSWKRAHGPISRGKSAGLTSRKVTYRVFTLRLVSPSDLPREIEPWALFHQKGLMIFLKGLMIFLHWKSMNLYGVGGCTSQANFFLSMLAFTPRTWENLKVQWLLGIITNFLAFFAGFLLALRKGTAGFHRTKYRVSKVYNNP